MSGLLFFFVLASYSIAKELQNIIFTSTVGINYIPIAKISAVIVMIPCIFLDGILVDRLKRYQLLIMYLSIYCIFGLILCCLLGYFKLNNQVLGWVFYMYVEGYIVFILGVFWSFANSINEPSDAENTYGFIVSCSKIGGILSAGFAYLLMFYAKFNIVYKLQLLLTISSTLLGIAAIYLYFTIKVRDEATLAGYHTSINEESKKTGAWEGVKLLFTKPYVIGIFFIILFCDIIVEIINYQRLLITIGTKPTSIASISLVAAKLYGQIFVMHLVGFLLSFFLTNIIMRTLGTGFALFVTPTLILISIIIYLVTQIDQVLILLYIVLHAMSYSISTPIRESLYIITSRDIQLKSKFAVDALAVKLARGTGHLFNFSMIKIFAQAQRQLITIASNIFCLFILIFWLLVCVLVRKRYNKAIDNKEIIT